MCVCMCMKECTFVVFESVNVNVCVGLNECVRAFMVSEKVDVCLNEYEWYSWYMRT